MSKRISGRWDYPREYQRRHVMRQLPAKPHIVMRNGRWRIYRNWFKSLWPDAACISGATIIELKHNINKSHDGYRF